ncbi:YadA-like family protein, partial [Acinetobacter haemolyticus]|uniref:YadA-like family protein n=5 Tax=Acinetobacter haemolyticus TaxID=29430 RepID=UPI00396A5D3D
QTNGSNSGAIKAGDTVDIGVVDPADTNLTATKTGNNVAFALSQDLSLTSVTTGNTVINNAGVTADKVTVGNVVIDKTTNQISGVEAGTNTKDAVNKGQLDALAAQQAENDNAAVKYDDAAVKDKVTLAGAGGTTLTNVKAGDVSATSTDAVNGSQLFTTNQKVDENTTNIATNTSNIAKNTGDISTLNTTVTNQGNQITTNTGDITTLKGGFNLQTNGSNSGAIKAGDTVDIGVVDPADTNLTATKTGNNVAFALSQDLSLTSVTTGNTVINNAGVTTDKVTVGNVVIDKTTNQISGVEAGTNTKDAVNKGQLDALAAQQAENDNAAVKYDDAAVKDKVTLAGVGGTTLTNVKAGDVSATSTDAVNGSQLFTTNQKVDENTTNIATNTSNIAKNTGDISTLNTTVTNQGNQITTNTGDITTLKGGFNLQTNGANSGAIKAGDTVDIGVVDPADTNLTATKTGNNVAFALSQDLNLNSVTTNQLQVGSVVVDKSTNTITGLSNKDLNGSDFATQGRAATEEQLKVVENQVVTTQTSLVNSLGGGAKVNADGTITGPTYNVAQSTQSNVGDALDALDKAIGSAATTSKTTVSNGENIVVNKSKNADGSDNYEVSTAKDLTVDSIKAGDTVLNNAGISIGNNTVVLNNTGLIIAGGPSVTTQGINAGSKQITNVAAGTNATDAVNKGQLDAAISNVNNNVNELANNAVKYDDASKDKITLGGAEGTTITNVKDGKIEQNSKDAVNGGQLWNVQEQVNKNTSDISNIQTNINNITDGKSGLVQQQTPNGEITVGKDTGGTTVSVAGKDGDRVVTGVKDGAISSTSKDAVNGSQLNVTNNKVVEFLGGGAGYDNITNSFTNPTYTVGGKDYNNVGGAVDALNKADQALDSKINNVSNRLEQAFYSTNQRIDNVEKRANAGIAAAMALEAAPYIAGKYTYAAGASYHGGENAVGVTLRKTADNGRWSITGGVAAASQGDPSVRIGISGVID